jgi:hypothetical protein
MIGLVLDADEVVVGKTVGLRMVLGLDRSRPVSHHQVEDRDQAVQRGQGRYEDQRG